MADIKEIHREILQALLREGKIAQDKMEDISTKLKTQKTIATLKEELGMKDSDIVSLLATLYRRSRISVDDIVAYFGVDKDAFLEYFAKNFNLEYVKLNDLSVDFDTAKKIPFAELKRFGALPYKEDDVNVYVALKNLFDIEAQDKIGAIFNRKILKVVVCDPTMIDKILAKLELNESIAALITQIRKELESTGTNEDSESSGILKLIETILRTAISNRASDIHIEPTQTECMVRSRIDGMLTETFIFDKDIYPPLVSRLKMLSNMDIAERRKPQDGRFSVQVLGKEYDFRISTLPVVNGESVVMRVLDKSKVIINLKDLGMPEETLSKFTKMSAAPYGMILVTGPTGSGKTTTLYAALNDIKSVEKKMITVEGPVEYQMGMIQQVHVNEKAGLTFASALRSILRQDPDIIMIGEIRDQETLRIAVQAALTGHLVFSTLHTNDAISAVTRVVDMGIEPYLISGALVGVEAQRLVRKLCPHCKQDIILPEAQLEKIVHLIPGDFQFCAPVGCEKCSQTGYLGREMVSEVLPISDKISTLIARSAPKEEIANAAYADGFKDFFTDGVRRAAMGVTSIAEVYRVARG